MANSAIIYCVECILNVLFQTYCEDLKAKENVSEKDLEELQDEEEGSEHTLESLPNTVEELKQLQQCYAQVWLF